MLAEEEPGRLDRFARGLAPAPLAPALLLSIAARPIPPRPLGARPVAALAPPGVPLAASAPPPAAPPATSAPLAAALVASRPRRGLGLGRDGEPELTSGRALAASRPALAAPLLAAPAPAPTAPPVAALLSRADANRACRCPRFHCFQRGPRFHRVHRVHRGPWVRRGPRRCPRSGARHGLRPSAEPPWRREGDRVGVRGSVLHGLVIFRASAPARGMWDRRVRLQQWKQNGGGRGTRLDGARPGPRAALLAALGSREAPGPWIGVRTCAGKGCSSELFLGARSARARAKGPSASTQNAPCGAAARQESRRERAAWVQSRCCPYRSRFDPTQPERLQNRAARAGGMVSSPCLPIT